MSFTTLHSPKLSLTSSFGSSLNLAEHLNESEIWQAFTRRQSSLKLKKAQKQQHATLPTSLGEKTPLMSASDHTDQLLLKEKESISLTLLVTICVVTLGSSFQFGYGTGVMNNSEAFMLEYFHSNALNYTLVGWSITVSCYGIGGLLGSIIGPKVIGKYCGRKTTLLYNNVFLVISSYFIIMAKAWWWQAIGRVFVGIVAGISTAVVPTYFSELSPISIRGAVGTMHQLGITVGIVISQWLSTPSLDIFGSEDKWQSLFIVPVLFGMVQCVVLPFCPESPSYLYQTQGRDAAKISLQRLQPDDEIVNMYLDLIQDELRAMDESQGTISTWELFSSKRLRKQLIVGIAVQLMMQFSGIDAVFYYSTSIFYEAEVNDPELATTLLGIINVAVTILAVKFMDSAGRKRLLTISWIGLLISYSVLTMSFVFKPYYGFMDKISVIATMGVIVFFAFGPGCIAWFIIAEIFPLHARDTAMAVGIFINWAANWFVAFTFPHLLQYTQPYTFLVFVGTAAFFLHFTINFLPETKGLSVAQVTDEFESVLLPTVCVCGLPSLKPEKNVSVETMASSTA